MSFFTICVRKIFVSVKRSQVEYILRLLLVSRGVLYISWRFWFCLLLFMKVASKYKVNFLHFFPVSPRLLIKFYTPIERSSAVLLPVDTLIFTLSSCKSLGVSWEKSWISCVGRWWPSAGWLLLRCLLSASAGVVLPFPSVSAQETHTMSVSSGVTQQSTLLPIHFLPSCLHAKPNHANVFRGGLCCSSFFENHVLTQWSVRGVSEWVDKLVWWVQIQQRARFYGSCGFLMPIPCGFHNASLCKERKRQEAGSLLCKRVCGLMTLSSVCLRTVALGVGHGFSSVFKKVAEATWQMCCAMLFCCPARARGGQGW